MYSDEDKVKYVFDSLGFVINTIILNEWLFIFKLKNNLFFKNLFLCSAWNYVSTVANLTKSSNARIMFLIHVLQYQYMGVYLHLMVKLREQMYP